jgi:hypothetical protein
VCNKFDPLCLGATVLGHVGASVATSVFSGIATAFGNTADSAINWLWGQLSSSTTVSLGGANFELDLGIVVSIAVVLCLGLFIIQLVVSALTRDAGGIGRALRGLVIATIGCAITLATLNLLLVGVDQLCAGIVKVSTGGTVATLGTKIIGDAVFTTAFASPATILILSLFAIVAVAIVWFALVIRKMLILITAIFAPIAFAGGVADLSRGWVRKWLEAMLALVFSKLILIIIFVIGLGVLGGMGSTGGSSPLASITGTITGLLILLVAGFSPWMALRLVHFTGDHMATMAQSASHASAGASTLVGAPQKMAQLKYSAASLGVGGSTSAAPTPHSGRNSHGAGERSSFGAKSVGTDGESHGARDTLPVTAPTEAGRSVGASPGVGSVSGATAKNEGGVSATPTMRTQSDKSVAPSTRDTLASSDLSSRIGSPESSRADPKSRDVDADAASTPSTPMTRLGQPSDSARPSVAPAAPTSSLPVPPVRANIPEPGRGSE